MEFNLRIWESSDQAITIRIFKSDSLYFPTYKLSSMGEYTGIGIRSNGFFHLGTKRVLIAGS